MATDSKFDMPGLSRGRGEEDSGPAKNGKPSLRSKIMLLLSSASTLERRRQELGIKFNRRINE